MKKMYNDPMVNVRYFNRESIMTASGIETAAQSAEDKAKEALNAAGASETITLMYD